MKIVLDTNVWLSAVFWSGEAEKIIESREKFEILISEDILKEITEVLDKETKFQKFIEDRKQKIEELIRTILSISTLTSTLSKVDIIKHKKDNIILELALDGEADYIISYNKHILDLIEFKGIRILSPGDFLKLIKTFNLS
jgi:putative PIN family toxin of toxin-antitoxin system